MNSKALLFIPLLYWLFQGCSPTTTENNQEITIVEQETAQHDSVFTKVDSTSKTPVMQDLTTDFPMRVDQFLKKEYQYKFRNKKMMNRSDTIFESSYVPGDSVSWTRYNFGNSMLLYNEDWLLTMKLHDAVLFDDFFIKYGTTKEAFFKLFTDLDSLVDQPYQEGLPLVQKSDSNHYWIRSMNNEMVGWMFGFENDSLYLLTYETYYEF